MSNTPSHKPCAPQDTEAFLDAADAIAERRGQRMTKIRRKVLRLLFESESPAKAYDLLEQLDGEGAAKPPTVYRALDFLQEAGLAHKIESLNAYVACGHASHRHRAVFLICDTCGGATELHSESTLAMLTRETTAAGFRMERAVVEARGLCSACQDGQ